MLMLLSRSVLGLDRLGGVAGGLCLLVLIAFLINFFAKRQRRRERAAWSRRLLRQDGYTWTADEDEEGSAMVAMPYSDMRRSCMYSGSSALPSKD